MIREVLNLEQLLAMGPDAAAALLSARLADDPSPQDADVLEAWLTHDPTHAAAWDRAEAGWDAFDDADGDELLDAMRHAARKARPASTPPRYRMAAAAAILLLLTGALVAVFASGRFGYGGARGLVANGGTTAAGAAQVYATAADQRIFDLPDGSRISLKANTRVETTFSPARRDLRLATGQAFFDVAHDASRPFVVQVGDQEVTALGTRFEVRIDADRVRVVLVEGSVAVRTAAAGRAPPTILRPGQQLDVQSGGPPVVSRAGASAAPAAQQGVVAFDNIPLSAAVAEFTRGSDDRIVIRDPAIAALRISGRFRTGDVMRFGQTLSQIHRIRMIRTAPRRFEIVAAR